MIQQMISRITQKSDLYVPTKQQNETNNGELNVEQLNVEESYRDYFQSHQANTQHFFTKKCVAEIAVTEESNIPKQKKCHQNR